MAEKYTAAQMIEALRASGGVIAAAARMLGCSRNTVKRYIRTYVTVEEVFEEENETSLDTAEEALLDYVRGELDGLDLKTRLQAIKFFLSTKGKDRGYTKKQERKHSGEFRHVRKIDWQSLSDKQLEALAAGAPAEKVVSEAQFRERR